MSLHLPAAGLLSSLFIASVAIAQTAPPAASTATAPAQPGATVGNSNENPAIATTHADTATPAHGANSFTRGQATSRLHHHGYQNIAALKKDADGVWRGTGTKDGASVQVWVDYKGSVGQQ